ncbi:MAG: tRNA (adenosine(37)-N6)-dimethylallyltransferase MiaA, partial [Alphaproteobacteria bacterium]|nr:tRNA (adenosine(37)-N6)-dimethylallyltransferase MiaA [Alphaproteobacteria bacterium]
MIELLGITSNTVVVIAGPTASGKSALAIELAERYNGVVINADASQIYKEIPVISAAPTKEEKQKVPHKLYEIFEAEKNGSVADWLPLVVQEIKQCQRDKKLPIVVGGTGFYIEALVKGASHIPETGKAINQ